MSPSKVLVFAEDPGAVTFLDGVEPALVAAGFTPIALVAGAASARDDAIECSGANADAVIIEHAPAAVVVGTSENLDSFAFALVAAARARRIPTFGAVDSAANAAFRFRGRTSQPFAHAPDFLLVPDNATAEAFTALAFATDRISVVGHPRLAELARMRGTADFADRRDALFPLAGERPVIVFVSELSTGLGDDPFRRTPDYTFAGTSESDRRTEIVAEELIRAARGLPSNPWIVLRLHPKQDPADVAALAAEFDQVSRAEPGLEVVGAADLVTGMTSVLLAEAAVLGRPVLSIIPMPAESAWLGDMADRIASVSTRAGLEGALRNWPAPLPPIEDEITNPSARMAEAIARGIDR